MPDKSAPTKILTVRVIGKSVRYGLKTYRPGEIMQIFEHQFDENNFSIIAESKYNKLGELIKNKYNKL